MKRFVSFIFSLSLLVVACAPQIQPTVLPEVILPTTTLPATEEPSVQPFAVDTPQGTPLPPEINAPIFESPSIINIEMLDEVFGWAMTEEKIIRTNDGGVTWYDVTPPGLTEAGYLAFTFFLDADHAWVQLPDMNRYPNGGTLYRTTDGGLTWEIFDTPFSGGSIHFVNESAGWTMADFGVGAGSMAVSIFKTVDGGGTWERVYTNDPNIEGAGDTLPLGGIKNFILPLDADTAWVGGVTYAPGQTYLYRSGDGGKTWFNINLVLPEDSAESELSVVAIKFLSATEGFLALRKSSETPEILAYRTSDGGNTWEALDVEFNGYGILETPSANEMIFYASDQFYVTNDAGVSLQQITPDIPFGNSVVDMSFANSQTGWVLFADASGARILYKTTDGGATWIQQAP
ncbi:MAG: hypothetical protein DYG85_02460 [Chloroflexi bacterium CFX1]|nr:hypothetical protein [Chloroflexi bacterium CFX1]MCQ3953243.1 hypothetical protein [Chloroflexota bacterium]MDL1920222.1 hypothetical protein [Chloroflexi bacterium CFX5]NUQ58928.1 hypothetical protein [Anaerolineales bacterium]